MSSNITQLDDQRLAKQLADLDWEIEPEKDLWPGVSAQIQHYPRPKNTQAKSNWASIAIAASITLALASLLFTSFTAINTQKIVASQESMMLYQQAQLELIEEQHQMVRVQFIQLLQQDKNNLNPEFIDEIQQVMSDVDDAAIQIKEAIKTQPNNPDYAAMLVMTYQHELKLLNRVKSRKGLSI